LLSHCAVAAVQGITRTRRLAVGAFAPGHLGELTQQVPFEMVDAVLAQTRTTQRRVRELPSRVVVYLLLAGCLFAEVGYRQVWHRLVAGLDGLAVPDPSEAALTKARGRVGPAPLRALFELLRGPAATLAHQVRWRGLLVCAVDGTIMTVPDSVANLTRFGKQRGGATGGSAYPMLRLVALVACGTRSIIDAVYGPITSGEITYAHTLLRSVRAGMLILGDRNFAAGHLWDAIAGLGADLLIRVRTDRYGPRLAVLRRLRDGSYRSCFAGRLVRVVEAEITVSTTAGTRTGRYRLITTLPGEHRHPASSLIRLYHERWEIETTYLELKSSILDGRVLRARTPAGIEQEVYALLVTYQALRTAMCDATNTRPGLDPDRASFTTAVNAARDQLVQAAGIIAGTDIDLVGEIGRLVLDNLMPQRRPRVNARTVKRAISKYNARGPNPDRATYKATISITILARADLTTGPAP
jgi:hypothetical protein